MSDDSYVDAFNGGDLIARVLSEHQVEYIFTLCGGHISPVLISCENKGIDIIDVRDEKHATFAADAISRLTGVPGVVAVTAGPGVTNSITAIKNAQQAESPLIVLGGATATMLEGRGALQDIDQISLLKSTTKWQTSIRKVNDIIPELEKAFTKAKSGVPGPVFVELPVDILYPEELVKEWYGKKSSSSTSIIGRLVNWYINRHVNKIFEGEYQSDTVKIREVEYPLPSGKEISKILDELSAATQPVMVLSSQAVIQVAQIDRLVSIIEQLNIPVFLSGMARGLLGKDHPLHIRHKRSNALRTADVIILIGVPLDFRLDYGRVLNRNGTVIAINRSKETLNMNKIFRGVDIKIRADPFETLEGIAEYYEDISDQWSDWHVELSQTNSDRDARIKDTASEDTEFVNPLDLCFKIDEVIDENSVIIADGGDFVATMSYIVQPRGPLRWLDPGPFGTLGVGAGFAIGAKLTYPDSIVWLFYGDGAAGFSINEFDTFVRHGIPVIAIVGNDASWQQIAREQVEIFETDLGTDLEYTRYDKVVEGYGATGIHVEEPDEVKDALLKAKELVKDGQPVLINVNIGKTDFRKGSISM